jgi:serine/threonine protein kinase HipA of HipAB toxin-antitoxin module
LARPRAVTVADLYWFGRLIGNSDMHPGNLGFHLVDARPLELAPAHDMLPMFLAPSRTGATRPLANGSPARAGSRRATAAHRLDRGGRGRVLA